MKKISHYFAVSTLILTLANSYLFAITDQSIDDASFLSWTQRTPEINVLIDNTFSIIARDKKSKWGSYMGGGHNGREKYNLLNIDDHDLINAIIQNAPSTQTEFYFMDLGAGNFQWGKALAKFLNDQNNIQDHITFHIIGIRGEAIVDQEITHDGKCSIYEFGNFKIENLQTEFEKRGLFLNNKIDLIVSTYVYRHLIDPLTTYIQAYNLLTPSSGLMISDGVHFLVDYDTSKDDPDIPMYFSISNAWLANMLKIQNIPFLLQQIPESDSASVFLTAKKNEHPLQLPLKHYQSITRYEVESQNSVSSRGSAIYSVNFKSTANNMTNFKQALFLAEHLNTNLYSHNLGDPINLYGNKELYDWANQNKLLDWYKGTKWNPLPSSTLESLKDDL